MKKLLLIGSMIGVSVQAAPTMSELQDHVSKHQKEVAAFVVASLLARPVYDLLTQWYNNDEKKAYGLQSFVGCHLGVKPESDAKAKRASAQVSLGGADLKIVMPTSLPKQVQKVLSPSEAIKVLKACCSVKGVKRSMNDFLGIMNDFCPRLVVALEARKSPVIADQEIAATEKVKRLIAEFSCGTFRVRGGFDLAEAVLVPLSVAASYLLYQVSHKQGNASSGQTVQK